jgi:hypothetical protein
MMWLNFDDEGGFEMNVLNENRFPGLSEGY